MLKRDVSLREGVGIGLLLLLAMLATVAVANAFFLFARQFWNDEWVTHLIASDPDLGRAWLALRTAIDNNTPTLFVVLRTLQYLTGSSSETLYRCFAFGVMWSTLLGLYLSLRVRFPVAVSLTSVLAVWAHPLVLSHTFEARYYGPLLCAAVWYAYWLERAHRQPRRRRAIVLAALVGIFLCTVHYFGVVCLFLILGTDLLRRRERDAWLTACLTAVPGVLALAACLPLLRVQRQALAMPTYLPRPGIGLIWAYLQELLLPGYLSGVVVLLGILLLGAAAGLAIETEDDDEGRPVAAVSGLASLLLYPLVMIALSLTIQGVLFVRYALPTLAGIAPAVAVATRRVPRLYLAALCLFFLFSGARELKHTASAQRDDEIETAKLMEVIRRSTGDAPVIFESYVPYVLVYYAPDLTSRVYILGPDAPDYAMKEQETPYYSMGRAGVAWQQDWAKRYEALYGPPRVMSWARLKELPRKFVVVGGNPIREFAPSGQPYPGFQLRHVDRSVYELIPE